MGDRGGMAMGCLCNNQCSIGGVLDFHRQEGALLMQLGETARTTFVRLCAIGCDLHGFVEQY